MTADQSEAEAAVADLTELAEACEMAPRVRRVIIEIYQMPKTAHAIRLLLAERRGLVEALTRIAAYDDEGANQNLKLTGGYGSIDEPGSVQIARSALQGKGGGGG